MSREKSNEPSRHRFTVDDYYLMAEAGILSPDENVELIEGDIIDMEPRVPLHAGTVTYLLELLWRTVDGRAFVRCHGPVRLSQYSELMPDFALLRERDDFYRAHHPRAEDVLLIIEVAGSALRFDRETKVPLYARHGIPEVWLVDLGGQRLVRYRSPEQGAYSLVDEPDLRAELEVAALDDVSVDLRKLFAY